MTEMSTIKKQFFSSLKRGTGEAFLILKNNPNIDFSNEIIKGALTNLAYDAQAEGSRAKYIYGFIKRAKQKEKIIKAVLKKLQSEKYDSWGLDQMCDLAVLFYKAGHLEAKGALYSRFEKNSLEDYELCGQEQLMEIDGLNGVLKVAEVIGKSLYYDKDKSEDSYIMDSFQEKNKSINVYSELEKAGKDNKYIHTYYESIKENKWKLSRHQRIKKFTYDIVKKKINSEGFMWLSVERANELTTEEVEMLAREFLDEKDKHRQERYLRFFIARKFPFDYQPILKIAKSRNPKNTRLVEYAVETLQYFKADEIRQFALEKFQKEKNPCDYLILLVSNYKNGDYKLLNEIANRFDNDDYIHSIVFGFIDIYQAYSTSECKEPLEIIYNKMNCGLHRFDIVELLIKNKVISNKVFKELEFDSYSEIRKLYRQTTKQQ